MIPITINGASIQIPESWNEVTVQQFLLLEQAANATNSIAATLAALTGLEYASIEAMTCDVSSGVMSAISFIGNAPDFSKMLCPDTISVGGRTLTVPKDLTEETFGQKVMMQMKLGECIDADNSLSSLIPFAIATYFYPLYTKKVYDSKAAEDFMKTTRHCKIMEAFPVANFFLSRYVTLLNGKRKT